MSSSAPSKPSASPFVIAAFVFMWVVGFYPLIASVLAIYSATAAVILLVCLPALMSVVLFPLWRLEERREQ